MAMYAPLTREHYPQEMELKVTEIQWLEKELRGYNANYQVGMERKLLGEMWEPEYRFVLLKWERSYATFENKRRVLLETTDPDQMIATLTMLLSIEREPK